MSHRRAAIVAFFAAACSGVGARAASAAAPPLPPVQYVTRMGTVQQNPVVNARDGTQSAPFRGRSVWTFGDTAMSVPGADGSYWDDNSLSWTGNLDAANGITLDHDLTDGIGTPREFLPYTAEEAHYNYTHDEAHCTKTPCGAEFAMWSAQVVGDPVRNRLLLFYVEIWRVSGRSGWRTVGGGIATWSPGGKIVRPIEDPGSPTPTLMWGQGDGGYTGGSVVVDGMLYSYGCSPDWIVMHCRVARVPLADVLDKSQWSYYAGSGNWSPDAGDAVPVFDGGAAGNSVFYCPYLGEYVAVYGQPLSDDVMFRVANHPWGPWSDAGRLFTGRPGWNGNIDYAAFAHPEFSQGNGRVQYLTYVHDTGFLRQEIRLVRIVFGGG